LEEKHRVLKGRISDKEEAAARGNNKYASQATVAREANLALARKKDEVNKEWGEFKIKLASCKDDLEDKGQRLVSKNNGALIEAQAAVENKFSPALDVINELKVQLGEAKSELMSSTLPSKNKNSRKRTSHGLTGKAVNSTTGKRHRNK